MFISGHKRRTDGRLRDNAALFQGGGLIMKRQIILTTFLLLCLAPSAWPKFKEDEQRYLDDQFKALLTQMQAVVTQVTVINAELAELKQSQSEIQVAIIH